MVTNEVVEPGLQADAYRVFFTESPRPMYVFDLATLAIVDVNTAALELYGYERDEFLDLTILNLRPPEEVPRLLDYLRHGEGESEVWHHRRKDGSSVEVEATWSRFPLGGKDTQLVVFTDVTSREEARRALEASEARFRTAIETILDGFMTLTAVRDERGQIVDFVFDYVNEAVARFLGLAPSDISGRRTTDLVPETRMRRFLELFANVVNDGRPYHDPACPGAYEEGGDVVSAIYDISIAKLEDGVAVSYRDVTASAAADQALRDSERRFRTVVEASPLGIALVSRSFQIVDANPAFCRLLGYEMEELLGLSIADLTHPEDLDLGADLVSKLFAGDIAEFTLEKRYLTKTGDIVWAKVSASAVLDHDQRGSAGVAIIEDITERKRGETLRRAAVAEAANLLAQLSPREREVMDLVVQGLTARQIGERFTISARTAESHLASIYRKLAVGSRAAAARAYEEVLGTLAGSTTSQSVRTQDP